MMAATERILQTETTFWNDRYSPTVLPTGSYLESTGEFIEWEEVEESEGDCKGLIDLSIHNLEMEGGYAKENTDLAIEGLVR